MLALAVTLLAACAAPLRVPANSRIDDSLAGCVKLLTREDAVRQLPAPDAWDSTLDGGEAWTWNLAFGEGASERRVTVRFTFDAAGTLLAFDVNGNRGLLIGTPFDRLQPSTTSSLGTRLSVSALAAPRADFSGRWLLHEGQQVPVIGSQIGERVELKHEDGQWAMRGTIRGRTISGYWYRVATDDPERQRQNTRWGYRAEFELAPTGDLMWYRVSSGDHSNWNRASFAVRADGPTGMQPLRAAVETTHWDFNGNTGGFVSQQPSVKVTAAGDRLEAERTQAGPAPLTAELLPYLDLPAEDVHAVVVRVRSWDGDTLDCLWAWDDGAGWASASRSLPRGEWHELRFPLEYRGRGDGRLRAIAFRLGGADARAAGARLEIDRVDIQRSFITE